MMTRRLVAALGILATLLATGSVRAQTAPAAAPAHADSVMHRLVVDASHLQPGQYLYQLSLMRDSTSTPLGEQRFVVSTLDYAGTPALLFARNGMQGVALASDSLVVRRDDLRPLHGIAMHGLARVAA